MGGILVTVSEGVCCIGPISSDPGHVDVVASRSMSPDKWVSLGAHAGWLAFSRASLVAPNGRGLSGLLNVRGGDGRTLPLIAMSSVSRKALFVF